MLPNPNYDIDFFFHLYVQRGAAKRLDMAALEMIYRLPNVKGLVVEEYNDDVVADLARDFNAKALSKYLAGYNHPNDQPAWVKNTDGAAARKVYNCIENHGNGFLSQLRKVHMANGLVVEHNVTYTFVVRARVDRFLGMDLELDKLPRDMLSTPRLTPTSPASFAKAPHWMEDMWGIGPPELMNKYTDLYHNLHRLFDESMALFTQNRSGWRNDMTGVANPWFCPEWLVARLVPAEKQNPIMYPIRCWEAAHNYPKAEMLRWGNPNFVEEVSFAGMKTNAKEFNTKLTCQRSGTSGHKISAPERNPQPWSPLCHAAHVPATPATPWPGLTGGNWGGVLQHTATQTCSHIKFHMPENHPLHVKGPGNVVSWVRPDFTKRAAVAFSGFLNRAHCADVSTRAKCSSIELTIQSYLKHLMLPNPNHRVDYFFHVFVQEGATKAQDIAALEMIYKLPNVKGLVVEVAGASNAEETVARGLVSGHNDWGGYLSELRKVALAQEMVREYAELNNVVYNHVVRARLDRFLAGDLDLDSLHVGKVSVPRRGGLGPLNSQSGRPDDSFAIGPMALMDTYTAAHATAQSKLSAAPQSCPGYLLAQQLPAGDVSFIDYPVQCWDVDGEYDLSVLRGWVALNLTDWTDLCEKDVAFRPCPQQAELPPPPPPVVQKVAEPAVPTVQPAVNATGEIFPAPAAALLEPAAAEPYPSPPPPPPPQPEGSPGETAVCIVGSLRIVRLRFSFIH
jgi:hypothetical protein